MGTSGQSTIRRVALWIAQAFAVIVLGAMVLGVVVLSAVDLLWGRG